MARTPVQPLEEVYNIMRQEEDMRSNGEETSQVSAFVAQTRLRYRDDTRDKSVVCSLCNRTGHSSDKCYAVIGYPECWGDRPKTRTLPGK